MNFKPQQCDFLGSIDEYRFFEHPYEGNEAPVLMELEGKMISTPFWELPETEEFREWFEKGCPCYREY